MQVSVVIPVYKAGKFIESAVKSALEQPETAEVILVEDGSPDDTLEICRRLEKKIREGQGFYASGKHQQRSRPVKESRY